VIDAASVKGLHPRSGVPGAVGRLSFLMRKCPPRGWDPTDLPKGSDAKAVRKAQESLLGTSYLRGSLTASDLLFEAGRISGSDVSPGDWDPSSADRVVRSCLVSLLGNTLQLGDSVGRRTISYLARRKPMDLTHFEPAVEYPVAGVYSRLRVLAAKLEAGLSPSLMGEADLKVLARGVLDPLAPETLGLTPPEREARAGSKIVRALTVAYRDPQVISRWLTADPSGSFLRTEAALLAKARETVKATL